MPFAIFREHQKKLLAFFAITAMIGFVLSDTLPRWQQAGGRGANDLVVADLGDVPVRMSDIALFRQGRVRANSFMGFVNYSGREGSYFGGVTEPEVLDAMILAREADRLGIPSTAEFARKWVERESNGVMNAALFETIRARIDPNLSGEQLLIELAKQIRIRIAGEEIASPNITPLDVFRSYRDQNERCSFRAVRFGVESYVGKVGEPPEADVRALFEKHKDALPEPDSATPGFKVPRRARAEFVSINVRELARKIKGGLAEDKLKAYYETRKAEFPADPGLPADLFLGEPGLTPPRYLPLAEIREALAGALAEEQAEEQVQDLFAKVRDEAVDPFSDKYQEAASEISDARKEGREAAGVSLPKAESLAAIAKRLGLAHDETPLLDHDGAEHYGQIATARTGLGRSADSMDFADVLLAKRTNMYEGFDLSDIGGDRYLVRKTADNPEHVATLDEARAEVVRAWKQDKARVIARKAADDFAAKVKADGGAIRGATVDDRPVIRIDSATRMKPGVPIPPQFPGQFQFQRGPASLATFPDMPDAGPRLIDAMFGLKPGAVAVEPDTPEDAYYVVTIENRSPVPYTALMGPNGAMPLYWSETLSDAMRANYASALVELREKANLKKTANAALTGEDGSSE